MFTIDTGRLCNGLECYLLRIFSQDKRRMKLFDISWCHGYKDYKELNATSPAKFSINNMGVYIVLDLMEIFSKAPRPWQG